MSKNQPKIEDKQAKNPLSKLLKIVQIRAKNLGNVLLSYFTHFWIYNIYCSNLESFYYF